MCNSDGEELKGGRRKWALTIFYNSCGLEGKSKVDVEDFGSEERRMRVL